MQMIARFFKLPGRILKTEITGLDKLFRGKKTLGILLCWPFISPCFVLHNENTFLILKVRASISVLKIPLIHMHGMMRA